LGALYERKRSDVIRRALVVEKVLAIPADVTKLKKIKFRKKSLKVISTSLIGSSTITLSWVNFSEL
jgi:hypothetical protein